MKFQDKAIIVTGGAGGIGRGIVTTLVKQGAKVTFFDINEEKGLEAETQINALGVGESMFVKVNLMDKEDVIAGFQKAIDKYGKLDGLVNCAQASRNLPFMETTEAEFELAFGTGFWPTFHLMKLSYPYLKETQGSIVNFASGAGLNGMHTQASYAAAKEAIRGITRVAANEWGVDNININIVCPIANSEGVQVWKEHNPAAYEGMVNNIPLRRLGDPENDIGRVVAFLLSEDASFMTGQTVMVDGGSVMLR